MFEADFCTCAHHLGLHGNSCILPAGDCCRTLAVAPKVCCLDEVSGIGPFLRHVTANRKSLSLARAYVHTRMLCRYDSSVLNLKMSHLTRQTQGTLRH